ncbi:hypothetical protein [Bremerella alba]|uniref:hypothetical protein n=1 Tax=Bremerella alba TaxID=980252 RepID=UPI001A9561D8|nr:hypothetical protein [Bremerella alba]
MAKPPSCKKPATGYRIPQKAYDLAISVPMEIADDFDVDPKVRLTAVNTIRQTIDHYHELQFQQDAINDGGKPSEVIVREDETFFENDAHAQADSTYQADPDQEPPQPRDHTT